MGEGGSRRGWKGPPGGSIGGEGPSGAIRGGGGVQSGRFGVIEEGGEGRHKLPLPPLAFPLIKTEYWDRAGGNIGTELVGILGLSWWKYWDRAGGNIGTELVGEGTLAMTVEGHQ